MNPRARAGTQEDGLKLVVVLAASDLDDVGKLQGKLVLCILEPNTHLVQEKLKEDLGGKWSNCRCGYCPTPTSLPSR